MAGAMAGAMANAMAQTAQKRFFGVLYGDKGDGGLLKKLRSVKSSSLTILILILLVFPATMGIIAFPKAFVRFLSHPEPEPEPEILKINQDDWPFDWGFLDGAFSCDLKGSGLTAVRHVMNSTEVQCEAHLRIVMQYPISTKFTFLRQMEIANSFLCNLLHCSVKEIHILQEEPREHNFAAYYIQEIAKLHKYGSRDLAALITKRLPQVLKKVTVVPLGHRVKYIDILKYINKHPQWKGEPILITNADIAVVDGFQNQKMLKAAVQNNSAVVLARWEPDTCRRFLGDKFLGFQKTCNCGDGQHCYDSYLVTYPMPRMLEYLGYHDGIDYEFGGLWNGENVFVIRLQEHGMNLWWGCDYFRLAHNHCSQLRANQVKSDKGEEIYLLGDKKLALPDDIPDFKEQLTTEDFLNLL
eukprot:CAMPEP_0167760030 /NCGR_PEP_ID=MMETSP0110_2-20121227/11358_1 /TAXON_ID=629695 /ORGANISM="Gymnochlora sp., Strain CCMP2014" /LENGTH=411 /DNA_ID=CAMNT_0007646493 /DNA_START=1 /DNA_END=1236 /DNA_ORIENTATION=-